MVHIVHKSLNKISRLTLSTRKLQQTAVAKEFKIDGRGRGKKEEGGKRKDTA